MSILNKYKHWGFKLKPLNNNYWDFAISKDATCSNSKTSSKKCLSAYINFGDEDCFADNFVRSYREYKWDEAVCDEIVLDDIGYTAIDNGLIYYEGWDKVSNQEFFDIFTESKLNIPSENTSLYLHSVTGNTGLYSYDFSKENGYVKLNGGFYQGFFKLCGFNYQILPTTIEDEWNVEFTIRPKYYIIDEKSLNNKYPENAGIFFYMGARAEDKFIQLYNCDLSKYEERIQPERKMCDNFLDGYFADDIEFPKDSYYDDEYHKKEKGEECGMVEPMENNSSDNKEFNKKKAKMLYHFLYEYGFKNYEVDTCGCHWGKPQVKENGDEYFTDDYRISRYFANYLNECDDYQEKDVIISGATLYTSEGELVSDSGYYEIKTDNKFLFFNRTKYGFTTANWDEDTVIVLTGSTNNEISDNLYLLMNRTESGYTTETINKYYADNQKEYDFLADIKNNAFALKYNEDGSITYRYLVSDCEAKDKYSILTETTKKHLIIDEIWNVINAKFKRVGANRMKIMLYVNGYLKFISKELPLFDFHSLNTTKEKQEGVPYNISVGGGTQGLCDSQWLNYEHAFEKILPIEKNFAGTFIGDIKEFKFFTCPLEFSQIKNNYLNIIKNNKVFI